VDADSMLALMKSYFEGKRPAEAMEDFARQSPAALLKESLDVMDFVVYLEEELGREIVMDELAQSLLDRNFGELADTVAHMLAAESPGPA
jgi:acyl carrier protein